ncbi:MAG: hypothetical protein JO027_02970, partial [Solirubrobacterales bacterium]|nr:hypothetical protein [Solirubrobacterales bacterium]
MAILTLPAALAPAAGAASTPALANVTNATTGEPDAASVSAVNACAPSTGLRATCLTKVLRVSGTGSLVHPVLRRAVSPDRLSARRPHIARASSAATVAAAAAPQPGTPAYLQQAYDLAYLAQSAGAGATVAIIDAYDAPNAEADLAAYRAKFSLAPCTTADGCFRKVGQDGGTDYPSSTNSGWEVETSLDLDAVSALCPNCRILLIEANSDQASDLAAAQAQAAQLGATVISDSWAVALSGQGAAQTFAGTGQYTFPGITTVAASGDDGYLGAHTNDYPAALAGVTAAGGTTLEPASASGVQSPRDFSESAWSGAGSGCAWQVAKPAWQTDTGCSGRSYSDLSADADPDTGMQVYDSDDGGWLVVGGTSEATPLIAAYYALLGTAVQGPSWAYANAALLNDPSSGSNGSCSSSIAYICTAGAGYDGPTGVGSISGAVAAGAPGIGGPGTNGSYAQTLTTDTAALQGGVYPNAADTTYWWEYGTTTAYGQLTPASDIGSGTAPVPVSDTLTGLQPGTTYHYRLVAQNSFGTEYGYDFTFTTQGATTGAVGQNSGDTSTQAPPLTTPAPLPTTTTVPPVTSSAPAGSSATSTGAGGAVATPVPAVHRISRVTIARIAVHGGVVQVVLRCHGSAPCRVSLQAHAGGRVIAADQARLRGNRQATVTLRLTHAFLAAIGHRRWSATLSVQSSTNGYPVTVTARF